MEKRGGGGGGWRWEKKWGGGDCILLWFRRVMVAAMYFARYPKPDPLKIGSVRWDSWGKNKTPYPRY